MIQLETRRVPRFALGTPARPDAGAVWRWLREVVFGQWRPLWAALLLLGAGYWAVAEYAASKTALRQAETGRYIAEFRGGSPVADAWRQLNAAWQGEAHRQEALLARLAAASGADFRRALQDYQHFVLETVAEYRLAPAIEAVRGFFLRLGVCVRVGNCDPAIAVAHLGDAGRGFRNQHYYHLEAEGQVTELDEALTLIVVRRP